LAYLIKLMAGGTNCLAMANLLTMRSGM